MFKKQQHLIVLIFTGPAATLSLILHSSVYPPIYVAVDHFDFKCGSHDILFYHCDKVAKW